MRRSRAEHPGRATELRCPECDSETINCERDTMLIAEAAELRDGALILAGPFRAVALDDAQLACADCGAELDGVEWAVERPLHVPHGGQPLSDAEALDRLAAELNEPGDWSGADVCELAADLLRRTGRPIADGPDDAAP